MLEIRCFEPSDISQVLEIESESFQSEAFSKEVFMGLYDVCSSLFLVAESGRRILGYIVTCLEANEGHVVSVAVDSSHRRQGIGRALVNSTLERLKSCGAKAVRLEVRRLNADAVSFWKAHRFNLLRTVPRYYSDGEDALEMRRTLEEKA